MPASHRFTSALFAAVVAAILATACKQEEAAVAPPEPAPAPSSWLISNVRVIDGTGAPAYLGAVRVEGAKILAAGRLEPLPGEQIIDGGGQALAPGFIDTHTHADRDLFERPGALEAVSQGITTIVAGQDGRSFVPLSDWFAKLEQQPAAVNAASYSGHNSLRAQVLGEDYRRHANAAEQERMESLLLADLEAGALGFGTGLEYDPGIYSEPAEVLSLARLAAQHGGRYISHIRSEDRRFEAALDEVIEIGRQTGMPVQISHFKLALASLWGRAPEFLAKLDAARLEGIDITADLYPYEYWQANMLVMLPKRDITDRKEVEFALSEIAPPEGVWMTRFEPQPEYVGKTITEIAALRDTDPVSVFMQLIAESTAWTKEHGKPADAIIATSMTEEDIIALLEWPHTNVCTDGYLIDLHPRARGSYPRILGRYVREMDRLSPEEAVQKMSGLAARHMGFTDRGEIQPGMAADLVLFDPETVIDHATPQEPEALSTGITTVWVNGVAVFDQGAVTGERPGVVLRRASSKAWGGGDG